MIIKKRQSEVWLMTNVNFLIIVWDIFEIFDWKYHQFWVFEKPTKFFHTDLGLIITHSAIKKFAEPFVITKKGGNICLLFKLNCGVIDFIDSGSDIIRKLCHI